jgi:curved DNA-binding protein CbpA
VEAAPGKDPPAPGFYLGFMNGQLREHPLVELIHEISSQAISGAVRLERGPAKAVVYFDAGQIIHAASNLRAHRLFECLRRWQPSAAQQLAASAENAPDMQVAAALFASGTFSRDEVEEMSARQAKEILYTVLLWIEGTWHFDPRVRLVDSPGVVIDAKPLIVEAARRLPVPFVVSRFEGSNGNLSSVAGNLDSVDLLPEEAFILSRVDIPMSVAELLTISGLPEQETLRSVYSLTVGGLLRRENGPRAFTAGQVASFLSVKAAPSQEAADPAPAATRKIEDKGEAKASPPIVEISPEQALDELFARLKNAGDFYDILDIGRRADPTEVKRAYHRLAKRFHPDRFHGEADKALLARIGSAFAKIAQAYETLKDKQLRAKYDLKLEAGRKLRSRSNMDRPHKTTNQGVESDAAKDAAWESASDLSASSAETKFQMGLQALNKGNYPAAIQLLGEAALTMPKQSRYRAYYGRALASNEKTRHNAEGEIQAAIALEASNASYRVMLAELYRDLGFARRALSELERALVIDPKNEAARQLAQSLRERV